MWYKNIKAQNGLTFILFGIGIFCSMYFVNLSSGLSQEEKYQVETEVFSELYNYLISHPDVEVDYFFIGVFGADPASEVLTYFEDSFPKVAPISNAMMTYGFSASIAHKSDRDKRGIIADIRTIDKVKGEKVRVLTRINYDRTSFANYELNLSKNDGSFQVISVQYPDKTVVE